MYYIMVLNMAIIFFINKCKKNQLSLFHSVTSDYRCGTHLFCLYEMYPISSTGAYVKGSVVVFLSHFFYLLLVEKQTSLMRFRS